MVYIYYYLNRKQRYPRFVKKIRYTRTSAQSLCKNNVGKFTHQARIADDKPSTGYVIYHDSGDCVHRYLEETNKVAVSAMKFCIYTAHKNCYLHFSTIPINKLQNIVMYSSIKFNSFLLIIFTCNIHILLLLLQQAAVSPKNNRSNRIRPCLNRKLNLIYG